MADSFHTSSHLLLLLSILFMCFSIKPLSAKILCLDEERSALSQFNQSFSIQKFASVDPLAYPKSASWIDADCCLWDGVECDPVTRHVIGLNLSSSYLSGPMDSNSSLFRLVHLERLNLADNHFNFSKIPSNLGGFGDLTVLNLSASAFSGEVPAEITKFSNMTTLDLGRNGDESGMQWLKLNELDFLNIVQNMRSLKKLDLSFVDISSTLPISLANLSSLTYLNLLSCNLFGHVPTSLQKLTKLNHLDLGKNNLSGSLPLSLGNLSEVSFLNLEDNKLSGNFPSWLANLTQLAYLSVSNNSFIPGDLSWVGNQNKLNELWLHDLSLAGEIPSSLCQLNHLQKLDLSYNQLTGQIPSCLSNLTELVTLDLRSNQLLGLEHPAIFSALTKLQFLSVTSNKLQGPHPILPPSLLDYCADHNSFTGEIPAMICEMGLLVYIDVSHNNLSGSIPQCLGRLKESLLVLNLANNFFGGEIPLTFSNLTSLKLIDLSYNQLGGQLPRSFVDCQMLQVIELSDNRIGGPFPYWLGELPRLEVLILRSNQFYGAIGTSLNQSAFSKLRILDLSINNFTGSLPEQLLVNLTSMKYIDDDQLAYLSVNHSKDMPDSLLYTSYESQMILANKGVYIKYWKIPNVIAAIDLSSNLFKGKIPASIGILKMVNLLNLSNNHLSGAIPATLTNLSSLESLDLSNNLLSGEIPMQLSQLNFLAFFNVSQNQLAGPIPQGSQFNTFENNSYMGNLGLCGKPLTKTCKDASSPPLLPIDEDGGDSDLFKDLEGAIIGYGCGLVAGLVAGFKIIPSKHEWFRKILR